MAQTQGQNDTVDHWNEKKISVGRPHQYTATPQKKEKKKKVTLPPTESTLQKTYPAAASQSIKPIPIG
uniref:Uncharacterized protein n=1 Tax=Apis cerana TaxID=7461 RepID=V9IDX9_APICE